MKAGNVYGDKEPHIYLRIQLEMALSLMSRRNCFRDPPASLQDFSTVALCT